MHEKERDLLKNNRVTLVPAGEFEQPGTVEALQLPDGTLLMNVHYTHVGTSGAAMAVHRRFLGAEVVVVHGTWKFIPDVKEEKDE